nr:hypothetical protein [Clostridia bacterium]
MKRKFIIFLTALITAACAVLYGCSCAGCSGDETLAFSSAFSGGNKPSANYTETLNYSVEYSADYLSNFKKDAGLDQFFTFEYEEGYYGSDFKIALPSELAEIKSDIKSDITVYKFTTMFSVKLKFLTLNGAACDYEHEETIKTSAYIAAADMSFAPIYTEEESQYCVVSVSGDKTEISVEESTNTTLYNKDEYIKTLTYREYKIDEQNIDGIKPKTKTDTIDYDFRSVIDNAELLFALRGVSLAEEDNTVIPVVSAAYNDPTPLKITNVKRASENMTISYVKNGVPTVIDDKPITYNTLEYRKNTTNAAGWAQSVNVQAKAAGDNGELDNLALPIKFAKPLFVYSGGNVVKMGSLVFTLTEVYVNN